MSSINFGNREEPDFDRQDHYDSSKLDKSKIEGEKVELNLSKNGIPVIAAAKRQNYIDLMDNVQTTAYDQDVIKLQEESETNSTHFPQLKNDVAVLARAAEVTKAFESNSTSPSEPKKPLFDFEDDSEIDSGEKTEEESHLEADSHQKAISEAGEEGKKVTEKEIKVVKEDTKVVEEENIATEKKFDNVVKQAIIDKPVDETNVADLASVTKEIIAKQEINVSSSAIEKIEKSVEIIEKLETADAKALADIAEILIDKANFGLI